MAHNSSLMGKYASRGHHRRLEAHKAGSLYISPQFAQLIVRAYLITMEMAYTPGTPPSPPPPRFNVISEEEDAQHLPPERQPTSCRDCTCSFTRLPLRFPSRLPSRFPPHRGNRLSIYVCRFYPRSERNFHKSYQLLSPLSQSATFNPTGERDPIVKLVFLPSAAKEERVVRGKCREISLTESTDCALKARHNHVRTTTAIPRDETLR